MNLAQKRLFIEILRTIKEGFYWMSCPRVIVNKLENQINGLEMLFHYKKGSTNDNG